MLIDFRTLFPKYSIQPKGVLHIGANVGEERTVYRELGIDRVAWVEANPDIFKRLQTNLLEFPLNVCYNFIATDEDGTKTLHISNNDSQSSSILELGTHLTAHPEVHFIGDVDVECRRLDRVIFPFDFDFLNIDVQGAELLVLKGLGERLKNIQWIYLEVNKEPLYKECAMVWEIDEYLEKYGFKRVETLWTGAGWGDCLLIK